MKALRRLGALLRKELVVLLRDPRMRFFVVVPPLVQLIVFGYAATFDVRQATVAWVDRAGTAETRALAWALASGGHYHLRREPSMAAAEEALARGRVRAIVRLGADFHRHPVIQVVADGSDSNSAQMILGQLAEALARAGGPAGPLRLEVRHLYNPNLEDRWFFVPGIMANVVLIATMILTAMSIVRERELGTLERLMVTPLGHLELLLGKLLPVAAIGLFDVTLITAVAVLWFGIPYRGSLLALFLGSALYLVGTLGIGLIISSFARTQQQATLTAFFVIMPLVILSGFAYPIANMPEPIQWLTVADPLRYFLVVVRGLFLKGSRLDELLPELGAMALLGCLALALSVLRLRRR
ncbi:MAG: ABC transporter permease, partial [Gammaproteobacteria bacterium]